MDKSLAPLIAVIALVILLSFIIINSDFGNITDSKKDEEKKSVTPKVNLRPETNEFSLSVNTSNGEGENSQLINIGESFGKAKNLLAENKSQEAEDTLRTLLVFDPNHSQALSLLGGILFYSNRYSEAEVIFRKQIRMDPNNHLAYNRLGSALAKQKKYEEAIDSSEIALGINPSSGQSHINLAGMYSVVGKKEKAIKHFQEAYGLLKYSILPLSYDEAFDNIRNSPEFQNIISQAQQKVKKKDPPGIEKKEPPKDPLFKSGEE